MTIQIRIEEKLSAGLELQHLDVQNESGNHNVADGAESHFRVVLVAEAFSGVPLISRHRRVNQLLASELQDIHALALHTYTEAEWQARHGDAPMSPPCLN
jgi:BolA protein